MEHGSTEEESIPVRREATEDEARQIDAAEVKEQTTAQTEIVGDGESGGKRVLVHMTLDPRLPMNRKSLTLTDEQIKAQFQEALEKHCSQIGWWPDGEGPDFIIGKREDGVWHAYAKTRESVNNKVKSWEDFERFSVDNRTTADVKKGA